QLDLLIGEWPDFGSYQRQNADADALAEHRNPEGGAIVAKSLRLDQRVFWISFHVRDMDRPAFEQTSSTNRTTSRLDWDTSDVVHEFGGVSVGLGMIESRALLSSNSGFVGLGKPGS